MTTQRINFENISSGSQNDALPMHIHLKIPISRETVTSKQRSKQILHCTIRSVKLNPYFL
jgi:hypothetical protein